MALEYSLSSAIEDGDLNGWASTSATEGCETKRTRDGSLRGALPARVPKKARPVHQKRGWFGRAGARSSS